MSDGSPPPDFTAALLARVRGRGIELWVEGTRLRFRTPRGSLPADLKSELAAHRAQIADALRNEAKSAKRHEAMAPNQVGIWHAQRLHPRTTAYNLGLATRLPSGLLEGHLEEALQTVVDRHDTLRTDYPEIEGMPVRRIVGYRSFQMAHAHVSEDSDLRTALRETALEPFDLEGGSLFRVTLVHDGDQAILLIVAHHLVLDGLSLQMLSREIADVYAALSTGNTPTPSRSQRDAYDGWARDKVSWTTEMDEEASTFWVDQLSPRPPHLALPLDEPARPTAPPRGATVTRHCSPECTAKVIEFTRRQGHSAFVGLLSAYHIFLHRLTGADDLIVGTPVHGRSLAQHVPVLGHLVNVIPVRMRNFRDATYTDVMTRISERLRSVAPYEDYPLPRITWALGEATGDREHPVRTFFALQDLQSFSQLRDSTKLHALEEVPFDHLEGQFPVALDVYHEDGRFRCAWRYDANVLHSKTVSTWADVFMGLLEDLPGSPDQAISRVPLRAREARSELTGPARESPTSVVHRISQQSLDTPERLAVEAPDGTYSYREVMDVAARVAASLAERGVEEGDRIAILLTRGRDMIPSLLGVLGAGCSFVPLDPALPPERLRSMVLDSEARALVSDRELSARLALSVPLVEVDDLSHLRATLVDPDPASEAYAIYTSGSTGTPKAVRVPHRALSNLLGSMRETPGMGPEDVLLAVTTLSFDIATLELFLPLMVGARVVIASDSEARDAVQLARRIETSGVSVLQTTPSRWRLLLMDGWQGDLKLKALSGGEALPRALGEELLPKVGELWNMYGPTETTVWSTVARVESGQPIRLGQPIANTTTAVVDTEGNTLPLGFAGELKISGDGVALGYHGRPELTASRFRTEVDSESETSYFTGDLARQRHDGSLEFLGRIDDQVKVRGFRIEPGEVESALQGVDEIGQALVAVRPNEEDGSVLVAGVVLVDGSTDFRPDLAARELRERLPEYMVPSEWHVLPELPSTTSGKADRRALLDRQALEGATVTASSTPASANARNAEEEILVDIWRQVLGRFHIGVHDDFFRLGGHSLTATMVVARVRKTFGVELPLSRLLQQPTVAATADWIRTASRTPTTPPLRAYGETDGVLSYSQERMWFLQQISPEDTSYNLATGIWMAGRLDRERLLQAVEEVERRHDILRSRFPATDGRATQVVGSPGNFGTLFEELPRGSSPSEAIRIATDELYRPYDLATDPPLRVVCVGVGESEELLAVGMHHVAGDQTSFEILLAEVVQLYSSNAVTAGLPPLKLTYRDFARWQRDNAGHGSGTESLEYWRSQLDGLIPLDVPGDRQRPSVRGHAGARASIPIPPGMLTGISELAVRGGATEFMVLLVAFKVLLYSRTRRTDLAVGVPTAHRDHEDLEGLVGTFVNTLVHRNDLSGNPSFLEALDRVKSTAIEALAHQSIPFEYLVRELKPSRDPSRTPLVQVLFNVARLDTARHRLPGIDTRPATLPVPSAQFDLTLFPEIHARRQAVDLVYSTELFDKATASAMLEQYEEILERAIADPNLRLSDLAQPSRAERWAVLDEWNRTESEAPLTSVLSAVRERAKRVPQDLAVVGVTGSWSWSGLAEAMDAVAYELRARGVGPGDRVGVALPRDRDLVSTLLGIWSVGAAYVPLDPSYPSTRLEWMASDAKLSAVFAREAFPWIGELPRIDSIGTVGSEDRGDDHAPGSDEVAYLIYTSGSTGQPKGVEVRQGAVANFLAAMAKRPGLTAQDRLLAITTISFDISVLELFLPLVVGSKLIIATEDEAADGFQLARLIDHHDVTVLQATPSTWRLLLSAGWAGKDDLTCFCGGEALTRELADQLLGRSGALWNMYGPTETTVWSTVAEITSSSSIDIGTPIDNTCIYVVDSALEIVPVGVPGELLIGGDGVACGYLHQPQLTAERFIESPFRPGDRLYRTGDLARYRRDGSLEHLGRLDTQVKVRGHRVELEEVEARLREHARVRDAVVTAQGDRLVAFFVPEPGHAPTTSELRRWLAESLPRFMIPSMFSSIGSVPRTPNGKTDRSQLPAARSRTPVVETGGVLEGEFEQVIAHVWKSLLDVDRVGPHDNFFELGGHSLLAMEVVAILERQAGIRLDPRELFFKSLRQLTPAEGIVGP